MNKNFPFLSQQIMQLMELLFSAAEMTAGLWDTLIKNIIGYFWGELVRGK